MIGNLLFAAAAASGGLVGPGAMTLRSSGSGRQGSGGGWGVVDRWALAFFVSGSSVREMNGLYKRLVKVDYTLGHVGGSSWRNERNGWTLLEGVVHEDDAADGDGRSRAAALLHAQRRSRTEWLIVDGAGVERFRSDGGQYLPRCCTAWTHLRERASYARLQPGDRAATRAALEGFWARGDVGTVISVSIGDGILVPFRDAPIQWRSDADGVARGVQGFRLRKLLRGDGAPPPSPAASAGTASAEEDLDELPWQIVGIMNKGKVAELQSQFAAHERETRGARGAELAARRLTWAQAHRGAPLSNDPCDVHGGCGALFARAMALLDGGAADAVAEVAAATSAIAAGAEGRGSESGGAAASVGRVCRAGAAVAVLEALLAADRDFTPSPPAPVAAATSLPLVEWLLRAHARARRCVSPRGAPAHSGFAIGDRVRFRATIDGFWERGDSATVLGLGRATMPIAVRHDRTGALIDVRAVQVEPGPGPGPAPAPAAVFDGAPAASRENATIAALRFFGAHDRVPGGTPPAVAPFDGAAAHDSSGSGLPYIAPLPRPDYYDILGLAPTFAAAQLRKRYRAASLRFHPDRPGGSAVAFAAAAEAHRVLADRTLRAAYDRGEEIHTEQPFSLAEEVERHYDPGASGWMPFGNPHTRRDASSEYHDFVARRERRAAAAAAAAAVAASTSKDRTHGGEAAAASECAEL